MTSAVQVTFWQVETVAQKLATICRLVQRHFVQAERTLITVPSEAAAHFLDRLLWSSPPESFLPHAISMSPLPAAILITTVQSNLNQAQILINLCSTASLIAKEFRQIHELDDRTDLSKYQLSKERQLTYQGWGNRVIVESYRD